MTMHHYPADHPLRQAFARYVAGLPGLADAVLHNPEVHATAKHFERALFEIDQALIAEGLDDDARSRVYIRAMGGGRPSPDAERARLAAMRAELPALTPEEMREFGINPNG